MRHTAILLFLIPYTLFSQNWEHTIGGETLDCGNSVQQTTDGGYVITGYSMSNITSRSEVYLFKTDSSGNVLWAKKYGDWYSKYGNAIQQTNDGGYVIVGDTYSNGNVGFDIYLIKTNSYGDTLWTKTYGGNNEDRGFSVQQTTDGGYIISGQTDLFGISNGDVYLIKTDSYGDTLWTRTFGGSHQDYGQSVQQTTDGGYVITGKTFGNGIVDIYIIKTDSLGNTEWEKKHDLEGFETGCSIQETTDGGFVITGETYPFDTLINSHNVFILKTDINAYDYYLKGWLLNHTSTYQTLTFYPESKKSSYVMGTNILYDTKK